MFEPFDVEAIGAEAEIVKRLWTKRGRPPLDSFVLHMRRFAEAARMSHHPLFAFDVRGGGRPDRADRSRSVATICNPERFEERRVVASAWLKLQRTTETGGMKADASRAWSAVSYTLSEFSDLLDPTDPEKMSDFVSLMGQTAGPVAGRIRGSACARAVDGTLEDFCTAFWSAFRARLDDQDPAPMEALEARWSEEYNRLIDIDLVSGDKPLKAAGGAR